MGPEIYKLLAAGICMGIGAIGPGVGQGIVASKALEAIGRNPETASKITPLMFVSMAVTESTGIYSLVVALIILFAF